MKARQPVGFDTALVAPNFQPAGPQPFFEVLDRVGILLL